MKCFAVAALAACAAGLAAAQGGAESRGALLYQNHCHECHSTKVHWREGKLVTDWASLTFQVRRWQAEAKLAWSEADVADVAQYLNARYYRFKGSAPRVGALPLPLAGS
jgi:mono/diheme cytochrome c family protein